MSGRANGGGVREQSGAKRSDEAMRGKREGGAGRDERWKEVKNARREVRGTGGRQWGFVRQEKDEGGREGKKISS